MNIIQGSNNPIVCRFRGVSEKIVMISAMLIQYSTTVKEWTTEDVTVDGDLLILPLTESDTMNLGNGNITLDIKGLTDDNRILFADLVKIKVCKRENNKHMTDQAGSDGDTVIDLDVLDGTVVRMSYSPYIGSNDNWFQYDDGLKAFFDTGVRAQGAKGDPGYTPIKGVDYFDGEPGYTPIKGKDYFDGEPGRPGNPGKDGKDYILTDADKQEIAEMATLDDYDEVKEEIEHLKSEKMYRYILRLEKVGTSFVVKDYVTREVLTFDAIKNAVSNTAHYVVCLYGNSKLRPQYVSTNEMMFIGLDRASAEAKVLRMLVTPTSVGYETYPLANKTDIVALQTDSTQLKESFMELEGRVQTLEDRPPVDVNPSDIANAVDDYMAEHPVSAEDTVARGEISRLSESVTNISDDLGDLKSEFVDVTINEYCNIPKSTITKNNVRIETDGSEIKINGTASASGIQVLANIRLKAGTYSFTAEFENMSTANDFALQLLNSSTSKIIKAYYNYTADKTFEFTLDADTTMVVRLYVHSGETASNSVIRASIRDKDPLVIVKFNNLAEWIHEYSDLVNKTSENSNKISRVKVSDYESSHGAIQYINGTENSGWVYANDVYYAVKIPVVNGYNVVRFPNFRAETNLNGQKVGTGMYFRDSNNASIGGFSQKKLSEGNCFVRIPANASSIVITSVIENPDIYFYKINDLNFVSPEMLEGETNEKIQDALDIGGCLNIKVSANGVYDTDTTLNVDYDNSIIEFNAIRYSGNDCAVKITCENSKISFRRIDSSSKGIKLVSIWEWFPVQFNTIDIGTIVSMSDCIELYPDKWDITGNRIVFSKLDASNSECCVRSASFGGRRYNTEQTYVGGDVINADWGFYGIGGNDKIENVCFDTDNGVFGSGVIFVAPRFAELQAKCRNVISDTETVRDYTKGRLLKVDKMELDQYNGMYMTTVIYYTAIDVSELVFLDSDEFLVPWYIQGEFRSPGGQKITSKELCVLGNELLVSKPISKKSKLIQSDTHSYPLYNTAHDIFRCMQYTEIYDRFIVEENAVSVYNLCPSYNPLAFNTFEVDQRSGARCIFKLSDGRIAFDGNQYENHVYKITLQLNMDGGRGDVIYYNDHRNEEILVEEII